MTFETKNKRNNETPDAWEARLTRRLADDLDAFLENADDETFLFAEETSASLLRTRRVKTRRFRTLATAAASLALFGCVAATARFYVATTPENAVKSTEANAETSLLAWSVATWDEAEWTRPLETRLANADVFGLYASAETKSESAEKASSELGAEVEDNALAEENVTESDSSEWLSVESLSDVATLEPLKYEPFLQAVVATLR